MQVPPAEPETAACRPRAVSLVKATASTADTAEASTTLPSWGTLPSARRQRLVAVLGAIVQRTRKECADER
jgi:hypothetical protein